MTSDLDLTNERAIKSMPCFRAKFISFLSFFVMDGKSTLTPGRFTCLLLPSLPPSITRHLKLNWSLSKTIKFMRPLSIVILEPFFTLLISPE